MDSHLYIEADEAAQMLGVTKATLYSYVSRKNLRSFPTDGSRRRRYWRADIAALREAEAVVDQADRLVQSTSLTLLTDSGMFYRGQDAVTLAETEHLEAIAGLLWQSDDAFAGAAPGGSPQVTALLRSVAELAPLEQALSVMAAIEHANPKSADLSAAGFVRASAGVVRWLAAIASGARHATTAPIHLVLAEGAGRPDHADLIRRALVLVADHEFDPTTYAVRAAANTGVTPYGVATVGLIVTRGQRLRQQRALSATRFIGDILRASNPVAEVEKAYRSGEALAGFAPPPVHRARDPRSAALLASMRDQFAGDDEFQRIDAALAAAADLSGSAPQFILPMTYLGLRLGFLDEPLAFSIPGRVVGWLAHAKEQFEVGHLIRPRATYIGKLPNGQ